MSNKRKELVTWLISLGWKRKDTKKEYSSSYLTAPIKFTLTKYIMNNISINDNLLNFFCIHILSLKIYGKIC